MSGFGKPEDYVDELRGLPEHERFWRTHCFACRQWGTVDGGQPGAKLREPTDENIRVLGWLRLEGGKCDRKLLCPHCAYIYRELQHERDALREELNHARNVVAGFIFGCKCEMIHKKSGEVKATGIKELDALRQRLEEAEKQRSAKCGGDYRHVEEVEFCTTHNQSSACCQRDEEIARLREALKKYGSHKGDGTCADYMGDTDRSCTCGLDAALAPKPTEPCSACESNFFPGKGIPVTADGKCAACGKPMDRQPKPTETGMIYIVEQVAQFVEDGANGYAGRDHRRDIANAIREKFCQPKPAADDSPKPPTRSDSDA